MSIHPITLLLEKAIASRAPLFDSGHETAFRLFNGFTEGFPALVADVYAHTLVLYDYADDPGSGKLVVEESLQYITTSLDWLRAGIVKTRNAITQEDRRGRFLFGTTVDRRIGEHGVRYALDLRMNLDASFYPDTRMLRQWLAENMRGKTVLNTFAYTGSLGVAALAGGASRVVQLDRSRRFLNLARDSYSLNGFPIHKQDFIAEDFHPAVARLRRLKTTFDCVIVDPPFFSQTPNGRIDQVNASARLINKVRPLLNDGGYLIAVNNALYVSGKEYMQTLQALCKDGYLKILELIPVPDDITGYERVGTLITDPAPFNHPTKIAVLEVKRNNKETG